MLNARDQVDTSGDHGGSMDQGRNRRRTCHGIRQPDKQRQLGRFTGHTQQHEEGDQRASHRVWRQPRLRACAEDLVKLQGAKIGEDQEHGDQQAKITDAVGDEGFLGSHGIADAILALFKPETDQQVGAQAHTFPADEHHQVVIGADQDHHGGDEQVEIDKETGEAPGSPLWRTSLCM